MRADRQCNYTKRCGNRQYGVSERRVRKRLYVQHHVLRDGDFERTSPRQSSRAVVRILQNSALHGIQSRRLPRRVRPSDFPNLIGKRGPSDFPDIIGKRGPSDFPDLTENQNLQRNGSSLRQLKMTARVVIFYTKFILLYIIIPYIYTEEKNQIISKRMKALKKCKMRDNIIV